MTLKSTQFYNFPLWEISDVKPLLDTVNNGTNKVDETMATQQTNIGKNTESIAELNNDLTNQLTAFKQLSNAITSFCHKRL